MNHKIDERVLTQKREKFAVSLRQSKKKLILDQRRMRLGTFFQNGCTVKIDSKDLEKLKIDIQRFCELAEKNVAITESSAHIEILSSIIDNPIFQSLYDDNNMGNLNALSDLMT